MRAEEMFAKYRELIEERSLTTYQLAHFQGVKEDDLIEAMSLAHADNEDAVQTSNTSDKTARIALCIKDISNRENDEWYRFLVQRYKELDDEISFFEHCLKRLGDKKYNIVMEILKGELTYEQIAEANGVARTTVCNYRKAAIDEIDKQYNLKESQEIAFMLS